MTPREHLSVAAPATVANLTVGFDCLGLALERPLERLDLKRTDTPGVSIAAIHGCDGLPMDPARNVSGKAAQSVLQHLGVAWGVELTIHKAVLPGSGIGSSAASAASAAVTDESTPPDIATTTRVLEGGPCNPKSIKLSIIRGT